MNLRALVPFRDRQTLARPELNVFGSLQREVDRLFDEFARGSGTLAVAGNGSLMPSMDISETDKEFVITAELPGMDESNIDVKFSDGTLTIKGEKKDEREEKQKDYHLSERRYGSFQRSFGVPDGVDADKIEAHFKNGVLTVTLPKRPEAQKSEKKIAINKA